MFFSLSKILWFFVQPSSLLLLVLAFGLWQLYRGRIGRAKKYLLLGLIGYGVCGLSPLAHFIAMPLEQRFSAPDKAEFKRGYDGIIVLGGAVDAVVSKARNNLSLNEAGERITEALDLASRLPNARVVISGGGETLLYNGASDGDAVKALFVRLVAHPERVEIEDRSLNTHENAVFTRQMLGDLTGQRWLLVTSAFHMPRAIGCFRQVGLQVTPWPVDYRTRGLADATRLFGQPSEGLRRMDIIVKEWIGLLVYRATGRSSALFPAP